MTNPNFFSLNNPENNSTGLERLNPKKGATSAKFERGKNRGLMERRGEFEIS